MAKNGEKLDMKAPTGDQLRVVSDKKGGSIAAPGGGEGHPLYFYIYTY